MNNSMGILIAPLIKAGLFAFLLYSIISILLFFLIREITVWYFKIDENTKSLGRIAESLDKISLASQFYAGEINYKRAEIDRLNAESLQKNSMSSQLHVSEINDERGEIERINNDVEYAKTINTKEVNNN